MLPAPVRLFAAFVAIISLLFTVASPAEAAGKDPFAGGSMRMSVLIGSGYAFDESYSVIGIGFGYFAAKGLELALDAESWSGSEPGMTKVSPSVRYVFSMSNTLKPYVGVFYRRTAIENYKDLDSTGGRAGIYFVFGQGSYFGAGGVYENYLSCDESVYRSCTSTYPEIIFAIAF